jgi:predicted nucleic acid-binding protein
MKVVSDTSPICYLWLIGHIELLPDLFNHIFIPEAVCFELKNKGTPAGLRNWINNPPAWLRIKSVKGKLDPSLYRLHPGESEAISLAQGLSADLILLDEKAARQVAISQGLRISGLLGILNEAASRKLLDLPEAIERLQHTNFRIAPYILRSLLYKHYR